MKNHSLFAYDFLFSDNFSKLSEQARLYYIKLMFYADNGFVSNPKGILDSLGYDKSIMIELKNNGDILTKQNRDEIFITAFFVHNKGINVSSWKSSIFAIYWKDLWIKSNRVATVRAKTKEETNENDDDTLVREMFN